jgi:hypothetical protein
LKLRADLRVYVANRALGESWVTPLSSRALDSNNYPDFGSQCKPNSAEMEQLLR